MAGLAAGGAEAVAPVVANWLYGSNPDVKKDAKDNVIASELTADQKNTLSNIIGLGTAGVTDLAGGSVTDVVSSTGLAQTAVEDNALKPQDLTAYFELALKYPKWNNKDRVLFDTLFKKDDDNAKLAMSVYEEIQSGQPLSEKAKANLDKLRNAFGSIDELKQSMNALIGSAEYSNQEWHSSGGKKGLSDTDFMNLKNTFLNTFNTDGELYILDTVLSYSPNNNVSSNQTNNTGTTSSDLNNISKDTVIGILKSFGAMGNVDVSASYCATCTNDYFPPGTPGMPNGSLGNDNSPLTTPSNEVQQIAFDTTNVVVFAAALVSGGKAILGRMPVTVFRVEGLPNTRLLISESGTVTVLGENTLWLNFGNKARAEEYLIQKVAGGLSNAEIKSFQVPKSLLKDLQQSAVPESKVYLYPNNPIIGDPTKAANQFGLRLDQINELNQVIIYGSGRNGN